MKKAALTAKERLGYLKVYWDGVLYLIFNKDKFTGLTSWKNNGTYSIEIFSNGQIILLELDTKEKWQSILDILDKNL